MKLLQTYIEQATLDRLIRNIYIAESFFLIFISNYIKMHHNLKLHKEALILLDDMPVYNIHNK